MTEFLKTRFNVVSPGLESQLTKVNFYVWIESTSHPYSSCESIMHGLINYIDAIAKCRHLKNGPVKWLCGSCLSEFIDWRYSQSCWYFRPSVVNCCSSNNSHTIAAGRKSGNGPGRNLPTWILINLRSSIINQSTLNLLRAHFSHKLLGEPHYTVYTRMYSV
jgi:hypothetical protein